MVPRIRCVFFEKSLYSVAILLAGAICLPSIGSAGFLAGCAIVSIHIICVLTFCDDDNKAFLMSEHGRDLFDSLVFDDMITVKNQCPFAQLEGLTGSQKIRRLFDMFDQVNQHSIRI